MITNCEDCGRCIGEKCSIYNQNKALLTIVKTKIGSESLVKIYTSIAE